MNFAQKKVCKPYVVGGWCLKGWWCHVIYKLNAVYNQPCGHHHTDKISGKKKDTGHEHVFN